MNPSSQCQCPCATYEYVHWFSVWGQDTQGCREFIKKGCQMVVEKKKRIFECRVIFYITLLAVILCFKTELYDFVNESSDLGSLEGEEYAFP